MFCNSENLEKILSQGRVERGKDSHFRGMACPVRSHWGLQATCSTLPGWPLGLEFSADCNDLSCLLSRSHAISYVVTKSFPTVYLSTLFSTSSNFTSSFLLVVLQVLQTNPRVSVLLWTLILSLTFFEKWYQLPWITLYPFGFRVLASY